MSTIIVFTVPLSRLTWCLQLNDDQLLEESFKVLFMLQQRLVHSDGKYRGGALELVVYPGNSSSISTFLARESPLCWAGLDPCALSLIEVVKKAKRKQTLWKGNQKKKLQKWRIEGNHVEPDSDHIHTSMKKTSVVSNPPRPSTSLHST